MSYLEKAQGLYQLIGEGKMFDAFEKYYHDEVVMQEATGEVREGKKLNREALQNWAANLETHHGAGVTAITSDEENGVTVVETWVDFKPKDGQRMKMEEVCVQKWKGDQIIHERFYYNIPG